MIRLVFLIFLRVVWKVVISFVGRLVMKFIVFDSRIFRLLGSFILWIVGLSVVKGMFLVNIFVLVNWLNSVDLFVLV